MLLPVIHHFAAEELAFLPLTDLKFSYEMVDLTALPQQVYLQLLYYTTICLSIISDIIMT